jgi:hypothetical protein
MKKDRCTTWIISLIVAAGLTATPVQADELYARIRGTVVDPSGASVSGAQITATNEATGIARELSVIPEISQPTVSCRTDLSQSANVPQ